MVGSAEIPGNSGWYCKICDKEMTVAQSQDQTASSPDCGSTLIHEHEVSVTPSARTIGVEYDAVVNSEYVERPQRVGKFRIIGHVASGGFGTVYRAYDGVLDQYVAIKIPRHDRLSDAQTEALIHEARMQAKLDHPHIVPIREAGRDPNGLPYIAMKWIAGTTLKQHVAENEVDHEQARKFASEIASAIDFANQKGITHRDLKPSNILIDENGKALVADFGLAVDSRELDETEVAAGTLPYMSPEQLSKGKTPVDHRSDIWSLGVIFYEMLGKSRPFAGDHIMDQIQNSSPPSLDESVPGRYADACLKCLEKVPAQRFQVASEFAASLTQKTQPDKKTIVNIWLVTIVMLVMFLLGGTAGLMYLWKPGGNGEGTANVKLLKRTGPGQVRKVIFPKGSKLSVSPDLVEIQAGKGDCYVELGTLDDDARILEIWMSQDKPHSGSGFVIGYKPSLSPIDQRGASFLFFQLRVHHEDGLFFVSRNQANIRKGNELDFAILDEKRIRTLEPDKAEKFRVQLGFSQIIHYIYGKLPQTRVGKNGELLPFKQITLIRRR